MEAAFNSLFRQNLYNRCYLKKLYINNYTIVCDTSIYFRLNWSIQKHYSTVRVRFAPSPTGLLHIGGYRTALYNFCFAKANNGKFIYRVEDTDKERNVAGAMETMYNDLKWCSIFPDESPFEPGNYGPYCQSERNQIYELHLNILLQKELAYKCFCSKERLADLKKSNNTFSYDNKCRSLSQKEVKELQKQGMMYCIRFKNIAYESFEDLVFGLRNIEANETEGDFVICKRNGIPTYHFASVIDDHLMKITHVLRGQEFLQTTSKHLSLYRALSWDPPKFGHLPLLKNIDGTKLSKRQSDISIKEMREQGFSPLALMNFVTLTGGGYERDKNSLLSFKEIIDVFNINTVGITTAVINRDKLLLLNRLDLQNKLNDNEETNVLIKLLQQEITSSHRNLDVDVTEQYALKVLRWCPTRAYSWKDLLLPKYDFIWSKPSDDSIKAEFTKLKVQPNHLLQLLYESFINVKEFNSEEISHHIKQCQQKVNLPTKITMYILRISLCGTPVGPPVAEVFLLLGKIRALERIKTAMFIADNKSNDD